MALNTFVKISNVNNLSDARYCAGMGVDLIGFNIDSESTGFIAPKKFVEIAEWITGVEFVGEFTSGSIHLIQEAIRQYPIHYIQFEHAEIANEIQSIDVSKIFRIDLKTQSDVQEIASIANYMADKVDYILMDGIEDFKKSAVRQILTEINTKVPVLVGGDLNKDNIQNIISDLPVKGINLKGGNEIKPGLKDYDDLADILEVIEMED